MSETNFLPGAHDVSFMNSTINVASTITINNNISNDKAISDAVTPLVPNPSTRFTGRTEIIEKLQEHFSANFTNGVQKRKYFLLHGMGGIGKTQICLKFIEEMSDHFSPVFWIDASSAGAILQGLKGICLLPAAKALSLNESSESALHWIGSLTENYLMVFDNADFLSSAELEGYFPPGQRGNILITSRNSTMRSLTSPENSLEVTEMEKDEAILLLLKASCLSTSSMEFKAEASKIVKELCCLPLAVDQAGAFIASGASNIGDYLDKYKHHRETLLSHSEFTGASKYNKSVYGTWELSYEEIQKRARSHDFHRARAADSALFLLALFPFFHHESISEEIFCYAATQKNQTMSHPDLPLAHSVLDRKVLSLNNDGTWDNFVFREGVRVLLSFCLIKKNTSGSVHSMHPLVNAWGRDRMSVGEKQRCSLLAFAMLSASLKNDETQSYGFRRSSVIHVRKSMQYSNNFFDDAYDKFGRLLREQGYSSEAEKLNIQVFDARKKILGEEHPATISAMGNFALTYRNLGKHTEAEKLGIQVLDAKKKILGEEHPHTILAKANLASTHRDLGKYTEAEKLEIQVLAARRKMYGEEHPHTIIAMRNLSATQKAMSQSMKVDNAENQVHNTSYGVPVTQDMEEGNVDSEVPHASNRVLGEDVSDAVGAPASLPPTTNLGDRIIHSEKKGNLCSSIGERISKFKPKLLLGIHKKRGNAAQS